MEFPRSNKTPGFHPGSVNQGAFSVPNSNAMPCDFFGRKASLEAGSQGVMALNAIDLGGGDDDGRRGFKPVSVAPGGVSSNMSFGQGNYSGVTGVSGADSDIMLSLDDILNDLQKKVVSGNNNVRSLGFGSGRSIVQENMHGGGVVDLPERNEQNIGEVALLHETENKAPHGGFFSLPGVNEQHRGESSGSHNQHEGEVAGPEGKREHQQESEVVHLQVANEPSGQYITNEHHNDEAAVCQGEGTSVSPHDNDKINGETTASVGGIHDQREGETTASVGGIPGQREGGQPEPVVTNDQGKAEGVQRTIEAENLQQSESEMAVEMVGGGELQPFLNTPKRGRQVSRKPSEIIDSPEWLPKGWSTELRTREAGSSAGTKDKYYYDPVSQRRFRSKSEVLSFLETGKVGRYRSKIKSDADATRKRNTSEVLLKNLASLDPNIRPTKVRWVYDDFDSSWIPFVNEKDLNGYNNKEGEHNFDLNHNSADACKE